MTEVIRDRDERRQERRIRDMFFMADDYNERLSELIEKTRKFKEIYIHKISKIKNYRQRTMALMLLGDIPVQYIAFVFNCTVQNIYYTIKRMSEE